LTLYLLHRRSSLPRILRRSIRLVSAPCWVGVLEPFREIGPSVWGRVGRQRKAWQTMRVILRRSHRELAGKRCRYWESLQCSAPTSSQFALDRGAACLHQSLRDARHWGMNSGPLERYPTPGHPPVLIFPVVNDDLLQFTPLGCQQSPSGRRMLYGHMKTSRWDYGEFVGLGGFERSTRAEQEAISCEQYNEHSVS